MNSFMLFDVTPNKEKKVLLYRDGEKNIHLTSEPCIRRANSPSFLIVSNNNNNSIATWVVVYRRN